MTVGEIEEVVKEVMGADPIEMVIKYHEGLIRLSRERIAEEERTIRMLQRRIKELTPTPKNIRIKE